MVSPEVVCVAPSEPRPSRRPSLLGTTAHQYAPFFVRRHEDYSKKVCSSPLFTVTGKVCRVCCWNHVSGILQSV